MSRRRPIRPKALTVGATIGICSPSFPGPALYKKRTEQATKALEQQGFRVVIPPPADEQLGYVAGTPERRALAIMELFNDPQIEMILSSIGGFNSNALLPCLDYESISKHPKIFIGYSDVTALLLGIHAKTGLITFHGPALLPQWGEFPQPFDYTVAWFRQITMEKMPPSPYRPPSEWTNQKVNWGRRPEEQIRGRFAPADWTCVRSGHATGIILGGNLETLNAIVGTPYCPDFTGAILLIEATAEEAELPRLDRALQHLELAGIMDSICGIVAARCPDASPKYGVSFLDMLSRYAVRHQIPAAADLDFGHTDPMLTIPLGIAAELTCRDGDVNLRLLEPAVI
jgi:muramoyltetrapeptide carboxypeptidase